MTIDRVAEIGGASKDFLATNRMAAPMVPYLTQGIQILSRWIRTNCKSNGVPVDANGRSGFAFTDSDDALLFKLTWC